MTVVEVLFYWCLTLSALVIIAGYVIYKEAKDISLLQSRINNFMESDVLEHAAMYKDIRELKNEKKNKGPMTDKDLGFEMKDD